MTDLGYDPKLELSPTFAEMQRQIALMRAAAQANEAAALKSNEALAGSRELLRRLQGDGWYWRM